MTITKQDIIILLHDITTYINESSPDDPAISIDECSKILSYINQEPPVVDVDELVAALVDPNQQEFHVLTGIAWVNKVYDHLVETGVIRGKD